MMSDNFSQARVAELLSSVAVVDVSPPPMVNRSATTMNAIKAYILRNGLGTGDPLPTEAQLGADLGVSRSSVREALRKLEALDIVQVRQGSGSYVGNMSLEPLVQTLVLRASLAESGNRTFLREVVEARRALDQGIAADVVAAHAHTRDPHLHDLVARMEALSKAGQRFMADDIAFHDGLIAGLGNQLIQQTYAAFWLVHMSIVPDLGPQVDEGLEQTAAAHGRMLAAAEEGDLAAYRTAIDEHYRPLMDILKA